jgi:hypothetical protein
MNQPFMGLNSRSLLYSGLIAGVAMGILSHIPLINCLNCLLLAWVWGGGIGAVYLYRRYEKNPTLSSTQGLVLGAAAGVVGAIVGGIASILLGGLGAAFSQAVDNFVGNNGSAITGFFLSSGFSILRIIRDIVIYGIVGAIGGLIATALIWKAPVAAAPPYTPPPAGPAA